MVRLVKILMIAIVFVAAVGIQSAHALSTILLSDGSTTITIQDGGLGDSNSMAGVVTYIGSVGVFNLNVTTGITYPVLGSLEYPELDMSDVSVSSVGGGTLTMQYSMTDFGETGNADFITAVGGTFSGPASFSAYLDPSNTLFGTGPGTQIAAIGPFASGAASGTVFTTLDPSGPYSITMESIISHSGSNTGIASSYNMQLLAKPNAVPEPASFLLLLTGGGALLAGKRSLKKKKTV